jgi:hypothetical protein
MLHSHAHDPGSENDQWFSGSGIFLNRSNSSKETMAIRLRFAQDAHFVFRGVATPLGSGDDFGVRMRGGRRGFGRDWRSTALRLATLASASFRASPGT